MSNSTASQQGNPITLFLAGDVMTGRGIDQLHLYSVHPVLYEPYVKNAKQYVQLAERSSGLLPEKVSYNYIWGDALAELEQRNPDVKIINLETAVTTHDEPWPKKEIHYRMHPGNTALLTEAGIDVCVLGNNHILDWGENGLRETLQILKEHGLITAGAGLNSKQAKKPAEINAGHERLLVFSYATPGAGTVKSWKAGNEKPGVNFLKRLGSNGAKKVADEITSFRHSDDRVVISLHWGDNWGYNVPPAQQKFAYHLIDSGVADVIYGHSSHHPKGIEVYKERLILYGCGDLINDYEGITGHEEYRGDLSLMYFPTLSPGGALISMKMTPMKIHQFRLTQAPQDDVDWLTERLNSEYAKFGTGIEQTNDGDLALLWGD